MAIESGDYGLRPEADIEFYAKSMGEPLEDREGRYRSAGLEPSDGGLCHPCGLCQARA